MKRSVFALGSQVSSAFPAMCGIQREAKKCVNHYHLSLSHKVTKTVKEVSLLLYNKNNITKIPYILDEIHIIFVLFL